MFTVLSAPLFRRAEADGAPVMAILLGEREAVVPLASLKAEFDIADDSPDGKMLAMIAGALDFVNGIRPGDPLPAEVLSGDASWEPGQSHLETACGKLRQNLVGWMLGQEIADGRVPAGAIPPGIGPTAARLQEPAFGAWLAAAQDAPAGAEAKPPATHQQVQAALVLAASVLGAGCKAEVEGMMADLAGELAFIEALRDRLLRRVQHMAAKIDWLARFSRPTGAQMDTLTQVKRLSEEGLRQIGARFDEVDARAAAVIPALFDLEKQRAFIRSNRNWLYRSQLAWEPLLDDWDAVREEYPRDLLARSYRFLAPRFMSLTEWFAQTQAALDRKRSRHMVW